MAVAVTGCGASSVGPKHRLKASGETRLLSLVSRARADVAQHQGAAARSLLDEFVTDVGTLRNSGQIGASAAAALERQARATVAHISSLSPASTTGTRSGSGLSTPATVNSTGVVVGDPKHQPALKRPHAPGPGDRAAGKPEPTGHDHPKPGHWPHGPKDHPHGPGPGDAQQHGAAGE